VDEIVQNVKKWWHSKSREGSITSMVQTTKFTFLIRRRTISVASKLGFDESKCRGVFRKILENEDANDGRHIHHKKFQDFNYLSHCGS